MVPLLFILCDVSYTSYDDQTDPSITNSFATAAFRFGHSMVQGMVKMMSTSSSVEQREFNLRDHYFNMNNYFIKQGKGLEQLIAGCISQPSQDMDGFVTEELTNFLFPEEAEFPVTLLLPW